MNTIKQQQAASGVQKVHAVIGGFHLVPPLTDDYFRQVIAALKDINPDYLMPAHCVGEPFYDMVRREMPGKVFQSNVGTRYTSSPNEHRVVGRRAKGTARRLHLPPGSQYPGTALPLMNEASRAHQLRSA